MTGVLSSAAANAPNSVSLLLSSAGKTEGAICGQASLQVT
jgi:hypothetical protein